MKHRLYNLFPTPVLLFSFEEEISNEVISAVMDYKSNSYNNFGNTTTNDSFVLSNPKLNQIKTFIDKCLYEYVDNIYGSNAYITKLQITQSWINYTTKNEYHHTHNHPNSLVSGVFYFNADDKFDEIAFFNPKYNQIELPIVKFTDFNINECSIRVKTGDLILFPSSLQHAVPNKVGDNERISLAFNTFVKGKLGKEEHLNFLEI